MPIEPYQEEDECIQDDVRDTLADKELMEVYARALGIGIG